LSIPEANRFALIGNPNRGDLAGVDVFEVTERIPWTTVE